MGMNAILEKPIFSSRFKLHVHLAQFVLVSIAVGLSVPRLFIKPAGAPSGRSGTIALGMGAKSLVLLTYILLSDYVPSFRKWHSYKAHMIIALLEVLFWSAVAGLIFMGNRKFCSGITCTLSWIVMGLAVIIIQSEIWCSAVCIREFKEFKLRRDGGAKIPAALPRRHDEEMHHLPSATSSPGSEIPKTAYGHVEQHSQQGWQGSQDRSHDARAPRYNHGQQRGGR